jgi:hypothetical protein
MSASKTGSSTMFTAACTTRSRTARIDKRPLLGRSRLRDEHPTGRQRPITAIPQFSGQFVEQPGNPGLLERGDHSGTRRCRSRTRAPDCGRGRAGSVRPGRRDPGAEDDRVDRQAVVIDQTACPQRVGHIGAGQHEQVTAIASTKQGALGARTGPLVVLPRTVETPSRVVTTDRISRAVSLPLPRCRLAASPRGGRRPRAGARRPAAPGAAPGVRRARARGWP